jgi:electron transfer flavoprotein beta subunit
LPTTGKMILFGTAAPAAPARVPIRTHRARRARMLRAVVGGPLGIGPGSRSKGETLANASGGSREGARLSFARVMALKVVVCMKEVPDPSAPKRIDPNTLRLDRSVDGALNEFDTHALEEALRLKDGEAETEVVVVSMGPERAVESMRKALAMGADRVVLVTDEGAAGSDLVATTAVLAKVLQRENADLILFGQQAGDSDGAVLWAALADRLQLPMVSQAASLELDGEKVRSKRQTEYGYDVLEAPLPCVVAVSDAINDPRYPSLKGIMGAKKKPQDVVSLSDLELAAQSAGEAGSRTEVYGLGEPPSRGETERIEDDGGSSAETILAYLSERKLI